MNTPETKTIVKAGEAHRSVAESLLDFINRDGTIESVEDYRAAPEVIADLKFKRDALDEQRRKWTDPLNAVIKSINEAFKPATEFYDQAETLLKDRLSSFYHRQNNLRSKLLSSIADISEPTKRDEVMEQAGAAEVPKLKGVSYRINWTGEVLDEPTLKKALIAEQRWELLTPDVKALQAYTKTLKDDPNIPGWRAFQRTVVAISKSLAK